MTERPMKRRRVSSDVVGDAATSESEADAVNGRISTPSSFNGFTTESADEMDDGQGDSEDDESIVRNGHKNQRSSVQTNGTHKVPQPERLRPAVGASAFKMQCAEMIRTIRPRYESKKDLVMPTLEKLETCLLQIPSHDPISIEDAEKKLLKSHKISVPFPDPRPPRDAKYQLSFSKPTSITMVGSFASRTATKIEDILSIDLAIQMPSTLFTEKDYLNHRYLHKRAYYLARLAAGIQDLRDAHLKLSFEPQNGNNLLPILRIQPASNSKDTPFARSKCEIKIIPFVGPEIFPASKLLPERNCVRPRTNAEPQDDIDLPPTPYYNASIQINTNTVTFTKLFDWAHASCSGYRDACVLGRVWLRQRGICGAVDRGGFGPFEWSALLALLLTGGGSGGRPALASTYDGQQLFKATLQWLSIRDLQKSSVTIGGNIPPLAVSKDTPMLFDSKRGLNLFARMSPWSYELLRKEAHATVTILSRNQDDQFDSTFISKIDEPVLRFDYLVKVPMEVFKTYARTELPTAAISSRLHDLYDILCRGLEGRATHISIVIPPSQPWPVNIKNSTNRFKGMLTIGIMVEPSVALRTVDKGPPAEEEEAAQAFRQLWGSKAELRRFKDGAILESAVWTSTQAGSILHEIVVHLLTTHFGELSANGLHFVGNDSKQIIDDFSPKTSVYDSVRTAYDSLAREIRGLQDLPLQIRQIRPSSSAVSYSSIDEPLGSGWSSHDPIDVIIQFEGSGRWPDDLTAIQMTKVAFLLKLGELLSDSGSKPVCRVGLENENLNMLNRSFLDVSHSSGALFRMRIHHDREQTLIERRLADKALTPKEREAAAAALSAYKRTFERRPAHAQAIELLATRHPALSPTLRLVKRWFAAHMFSPHFAPELIETLAARQFTHFAPWSAAPATPQTGLLRTLLFLSRWDWVHTPLLVHFGAAAARGPELAAAQTRFRAWREIDPALNRVVLFVATNLDADGHSWTEFAPGKAVAARMTALASAAMAVVRTNGAALDTARLFAPSLKDYDFVLHLNPRVTRAALRNATAKGAGRFKNLRQQRGDESARMRPVDAFVHELANVYGDAALFFYDAQGGAAVAGAWSPGTARRRWKVGLTHSTAPVAAEGAEGDGDAVANTDAMVAEMARLGGDMVSSVQQKS